MAITTYTDDESGEELFRVRIRRSSTTVKGVNIDKKVNGFKTRKDAERSERQLYILAERELQEAERKGSLFESIVDEWEVTARKGSIFIRELGKQTLEDYVFMIRTHCADWMKLHINEIDRARAWMTLDKVDRELSIGRRKRLRTAIDAVYKWGMLAGKIHGIQGPPTEGYKSLNKEEEKMPEILTLEQIRALLLYPRM